MKSDVSEGAKGPKLIVHKGVGAVIADVRPGPTIDSILKLGTLGASGVMFDRYRRAFGGLWVGGDLDLFEDRLRFSPNALNAAVQIGDMSREIMLLAVTNVAWRFGLVTGIVDVTHNGGCFTFRCYGSKALTATIQAAIAEVTTGPQPLPT